MHAQREYRTVAECGCPKRRSAGARSAPLPHDLPTQTWLGAAADARSGCMGSSSPPSVHAIAALMPPMDPPASRSRPGETLVVRKSLSRPVPGSVAVLPEDRCLFECFSSCWWPRAAVLSTLSPVLFVHPICRVQRPRWRQHRPLWSPGAPPGELGDCSRAAMAGRRQSTRLAPPRCALQRPPTLPGSMWPGRAGRVFSRCGP